MPVHPPVNTRVIDWLRLLLAAYVCAHHASYLLWQNPAFAGSFLPESMAAAAPTGVFSTLLAGASLFWEEAVHLFFIISGFCIHYRVAAKPGDEGFRTFATGPYLKQRLLRIVPPCWAAILLTVGGDAAGRALFPALYGQQFLTRETGTGWFHFVGNLLFLQQDTGPVKIYGSNVPLWSLHCEMMYYLAYPLMIAVVSRLKWRLAGWVGLFAASVAVLLVFPGSMLPRAVREAHFWLGGAVAAELFLRHGWRLGWWAVVLGGGLMLHETFLEWWQPTVAGAVAKVLALSAKAGKLVGGELLFLGLLGVSQLGRPFGALLDRLTLRTNPGYSLYLVHYPLHMLVAAAWLKAVGPLPATPWLALGSTAAAIAFSFVFYKVVEEPSLRRKAVV